MDDGRRGSMLRHNSICQTQHGNTALIAAIKLGRIACARLLLEGGADVNASNNVRDLIAVFERSNIEYYC
jgi:ankyrin repeat protein